MSDQRTIHLGGVNREVLTPIVRQVTNRGHAELVDWHVQALQGGLGDLGAGLVGVYRFSGHVSEQGVSYPWSIVLKSAQGNAESETVDYLAREWCAYQSGFLTSLSGAIMAPRCFGTVKSTENALWIWMADLGDVREERWSLDSHALVARYFGVWNGASLVADRKPDFPWFCHSTAREWLQQAEPSIDVLRASLQHPVIEHLYPGGEAQAILCLWEECPRFLSALAQLPQTICHNDAFRRNLSIRQHGDHNTQIVTQIVAFDWANVGYGAVGEELAAMVAGNLAFDEIPLTQVSKLTEVVFASYMEGLRQAGWNGDPQLVRLGFTAAAAMKYGFPYHLSYLFSEQGKGQLEEILNETPTDTFQVSAEKQFIFELAEEARVLIQALGL